MCGIFCSLGNTHHLLPNDEIAQRLASRGPDCINTVQTTYPHTAAQQNETTTRDVCVTLSSTVLSLRGSNVFTQPCQDSGGKYTLCWNGEAWSIGGELTTGNDTREVLKLLADALKPSSSPNHAPMEPLSSATIVSEALSTVAGPYAFVLFEHTRGRLFFGRDFLGRRSLLSKTTEDGDFMISSVSDGNSDDGWTEIEANGVYCIDLHIRDPIGIPKATWDISNWYMQRVGRFVAVCSPYRHIDDKSADGEVGQSVIPRLSLNKDISCNASPLTVHSTAVEALEDILRKSVWLRVSNIPEPPLLDTGLSASGRAKLAILFSGGLDCTVLARISHDFLPQDEPIDLLNVAFENPRIHKNVKTEIGESAYELCPDRITGRASYVELRKTCPGRDWGFVAIDVPHEETVLHRQKVVSLMHPHNTEMDLSICLALYFAARGVGQIDTANAGNVAYTTTARVLLSGLGADELFGGYTRHATAFRHRGLDGLLNELELDVSRLRQRNLGRDDRVMAHWSKEVRFPYLDESLLSWALNMPISQKCGFGERETDTISIVEDGTESLEPGKKVLRCLAWKLGMKDVAKEKKRAIQFGARTAKMETRKTKGTQLLS